MLSLFDVEPIYLAYVDRERFHVSAIGSRTANIQMESGLPFLSFVFASDLSRSRFPPAGLML